MEPQERLEPIGFIIILLCIIVAVFFTRKLLIFFVFYFPVKVVSKVARGSAKLARNESPLAVVLAKEAHTKQQARQQAELETAKAKAAWAKANPEAARAEADAEVARAKAEAEAFLGTAKDIY